jgi:hypothetical protein
MDFASECSSATAGDVSDAVVPKTSRSITCSYEASWEATWKKTSLPFAVFATEKSISVPQTAGPSRMYNRNALLEVPSAPLRCSRTLRKVRQTDLRSVSTKLRSDRYWEKQ